MCDRCRTKEENNQLYTGIYLRKRQEVDGLDARFQQLGHDAYDANGELTPEGRRLKRLKALAEAELEEEIELREKRSLRRG